MDQVIYGYLIEVETMLLMKYKVFLVEIENKMTMLDVQSFIQHLQFKNEEIEKNQGKDSFSKCLVYLRDILNFMTLKDDKIR